MTPKSSAASPQLGSDHRGVRRVEGEFDRGDRGGVDASHAVSVSQPAAVARLIDEAARATTR
jgi:hypothetical protein